MGLASLLHGSHRPAGRGVTIGTPRLYEAFAAVGLPRRRTVFRTLVAASRVQPGERVLDVGCGTGFFARMLSEAVGPDGTVVGVDAAPEMVAYANRKVRRDRNCRFQVGTAESLGLPSGHFDVVVSSLMMHHLPGDLQLPALREMRRVLRPGGRLLVADFRIGGGIGWRLVAALTHARAMQDKVPDLERLVAEAGFKGIGSGEAPPWLHYVCANSS